MKNGTYVGKTYRVVKSLGEGGTAQVYLILHCRTLKLFALKVIPLNGRTWTGAEREYLRLLRHPGLPEIQDLFEEAGCACLVMEYISGKTLWELKKERGYLGEREVLQYMEQLLDILQYLHSRVPPLIHGDIKPANLMLNEEGRLVLLDFGASFTEGSEQGTGWGTFGYASPEQLHGYPVLDQRSDLYSLGRTFRSLIGEKASKELKRILDKCEEPNRVHRFSSAKEVYRAVLELRGKKRKKIRRLLVLTAGGLGLAGCLIMAQKKAEQEIQYQFLLQSHQLSNFKSAVRSFPDREEAYQKLLQVFLEDAVFSREESCQMEQLLTEYEEEFRQNRKGYSSFCYEMGLAYWYSFSEQGGKSYGADWFGKAVLGNLSEEKACWAQIYLKLGAYYVERARQKRTGENGESWKRFLEILDEAEKLLQTREKEKERLIMVQEELLVQFYDMLPLLKEQAVSGEKLSEVLQNIKKLSTEYDTRLFKLAEEGLEAVIKR